MFSKNYKKLIPAGAIIALFWGQLFSPLLISAQEASPSATPTVTPEASPSATPTPTVLWTENGSAYTTETLLPDVTYRFPPNDKVSLIFTKLPDASGTVTVKEHNILL